METFDPGSGKPFAQVAPGNGADVQAAVASSERAFGDWRHVEPGRRAGLLRNAAALVRANEPRLAVAETLDSGKPLADSRIDVNTVARFLDYYAGATTTEARRLG